MLISPQGEIVLFDDGVWNHCDLPISHSVFWTAGAGKCGSNQPLESLTRSSYNGLPLIGWRGTAMARTRPEISTATKALLKVIKPLTAKEERDAAAAAVRHMSGEMSERYQVFPAELRIPKPSTPNSAPKRTIAVLILDYEKRRTTEVLVDPSGKLDQKTDLTGFQPVFLPVEIQQARKIADADERVYRITRVRGVFASAFGPHATGQRGARVIGLRYATVDRNRNARLLGEAVVDLSEQKLVRFDETRTEGS